MDTAHTTDTAASSALATSENVAVRVHSRLQGAAADAVLDGDQLKESAVQEEIKDINRETVKEAVKETVKETIKDKVAAAKAPKITAATRTFGTKSLKKSDVRHLVRNELDQIDMSQNQSDLMALDFSQLTRDVEAAEAESGESASIKSEKAEILEESPTAPIIDSDAGVLASEQVEAEASLVENNSGDCESFDASPVDEETVRKQEPAVAHDVIVGPDDRVSKKDLVSLLEGFVRIIKTDDAPVAAASRGITTVTGTGLELSRERALTVNEARVDDRTVEIDQLRGLVIEAQDTIIKLLTDRVDDRSRIATLEAQLSLIPDLQAQADRAMSVAVRTEEYRTELTKMKFELDRFRLFRVRVEGEQKKGSVFNRIQKWLFSRPNRPDETLLRKD